MTEAETVELELVGDTIADALARAQATFETPKKSRTVRVQTRDAGTYTFSYAELADVLAAVEPSLTREGIALTQTPAVDLERKTVALTTELRRGADVLAFGPLELPIARLDVQGIGSAITYGRRYQLSAVLGVAAEEDDDGAAASGRGDAQSAADAPSAGSRRKVPEARMRKLHGLAKAKGITHEQMTDWAGRHLGIETLAELDVRGAAELEKALRELPDVPDDATATVGIEGSASSSRSSSREADAAGVGSDAAEESGGDAGGSAELPAEQGASS